MAIYKEYAQVYDQSGQIAFSLKMIPYLDRLLERHPAPGRTLLELACGTGTVAIAMASAGWRVYGVDASADMLIEARRKAQAEDIAITWSQQDMRQITLPDRIDLTTCLYDSMNYMLTSRDLTTVFQQVYDALRPGGLYIFDMNTAYMLSTIWNDETCYMDDKDFTVILHNDYDDLRQRAYATLTVFQRVSETDYQKFVVKHAEQAYPEEHIATLLVDVGFDLEARYKCFSFERPDATTTRIMWVARRSQQA